MGDPNTPGRISVTVKQDTKEGTWIVFHGSPGEVRTQIIETFNIDASGETAGLPLHELILEVTKQFKGAGNVANALGGRVIRTERNVEDVPTGTGSAWDRAAGSSDEPAVDPEVARLTAAIEEATEVVALQELYARNKATFEANADLFAAWNAKGVALSS